MADIIEQRFNELMSGIFGSEWKPITGVKETNNFISPLAYDEDFEYYRSTLINMIKDLNTVYDSIPSELQKLIQTVKGLADKKNCNGAYAELCALHVLNVPEHPPIVMDTTFSATESLASRMGQINTNVDGVIGEDFLFFDTKIFSDPVGAIFKSVTDVALKQLRENGVVSKMERLSIQTEYPHIASEKDYQSCVGDLINELVNDYTPQIKLLQSKLRPEISYVFNRGGVTTTMSWYDPHYRAKELAPTIFQRYANKFMVRKPFLLVMVNHPWYNQVDTNVFGFNELMYRALARRVFMQYRHSIELASAVISQYRGEETMWEVSQHLSGIMFIDAHTTTKKEHLHDIHLYLNPNAKNKIKGDNPYFDHLMYKPYCSFIVDDFAHDNY